MNRRSPVREVVLVAGFGVALGVVAWLIFAAASYRIRLGLCIALAAAATATWRLIVAAQPPPDPVTGTSGDEEPEWGGFANLSSLEHRLSWGSVDRERYESRLRPQLVRIVEERLRERHGVDPARQPDLARRIVGEPLWQLMTGPPATGARPPSPSAVAELLAHIERI